MILLEPGRAGRRRLTAVLLAALVTTRLAVARADPEEPLTEIELFRLEEEVRDTVTSITKLKQDLREAPAVVSTISREEIAARGYRSVMEILGALPGIHVIDDLVFSDAGVRGVHGGVEGASRLMKVMIDGQPVPFRPTSGYALGPELIPVEIIERVELIRGPVSALYGANAFLGVVNIITQSGADLETVAIGGRVGGMQGSDSWHPWAGASLFGGTKVQNLELIAAASYDYRDRSGLPLPTSSPSYANYSAYPALFSQNDLSHPRSLYARLSYDAGRFGLVRLSGALQNTDSKQEWVVNSIVPGANLALTHRTRVDQANHFARLEWSRHLGALELLTSVAYGWGGIGSGDLSDERDPLLDRKRERSYQSVTTVAEARYQPRRAFSLVGGADYDAEFETPQRTYSLYKASAPPFGPGDLHLISQPQKDRLYQNVGLYLQGIYNPIVSLGLTAGLRFDYHSLYHDVWSARLGVVSLIGRGGFLKALGGRSFKAPSDDQLHGQASYKGALQGNPSLLPQYAYTAELVGGWDQPGRNFVSASAFYTRIENKVEFAPQVDQLQAQNIGTLDTIGVELESKFRRNLLHFLELGWWANLTWILYNHGESSSSSLAASVAEPYPYLMFNTGLDATKARWHLRLAAQLQAVGPVPQSASNAFIDRRNGSPAPDLQSYAVFGLSLSTVGLKPFKRKELTITLNAWNLNNSGHVQPGTGGVNIPARGRVLLLDVVQRF